MTYKPRDLSFIAHPLIKDERDLEKIIRCVDRTNFSWPEERYSETGHSGIYWILRSLAESAGITPDAKFCDVGFGSGTVLATFAILGYRTYGIDISDQTFEHANPFFERVQQAFGKFRHQPILGNAEIKTGEHIDFTFSDGTRIRDMNLYYAYLSDESAACPIVMHSISPGKGAFMIHSWMIFYTPELYALRREENLRRGWRDGPEFPTYASLGFRLVNEDKQRKEVFEEDKIGVMQPAYCPIFVKE